jgi:hypothetical protein
MSKRSAGRPKSWGADDVAVFKKVVRAHGLLAGHKVLNSGVEVDGEVWNYSISLPTLSKYVKSRVAGAPVKLSRGRPQKVAA